MISEVSAQVALQELVHEPRARAWIDVRSEGEAAAAEIPGFINAPVLTNSERHEVGIVYKRQGQAAAISLGHQLVGPHRAERVREWRKLAQASQTGEAVVACWRGGLRSRTSAQWLSEAQGDITRVATIRGGYKAMRGVLLEELTASHFPKDMLVLAGPTGSGKTDLLQAAGHLAVDLEGHAAHRGSAFGRIFGAKQPSQATFENRLLFDLFSRRLRGHSVPLVLEDESLPIGDVRLPRPIYDALIRSPVILVEATVEERAFRLAQHYGVEDSRAHGSEKVRDSLLRAVQRISRRLGGLRSARLSGMIEIAFARDPFSVQSHLDWVSYLLVEHYDAYYLRSIERLQRPVLFKGNRKECESWLRKLSLQGRSV